MRFFIYCPANTVTGGTELVHQFSMCLSDHNIENYIIYDILPVSQSAPTPKRFQRYGAKYVRHYVDSEDSILVLPETKIEDSYLDICKKGQIMIWWMSIDNYLHGGLAGIVSEPDIHGLKGRNNITNFWQSLYAKDFLKNKMGISYSMRLMDYINSEIVGIGRLFRHTFKRENICLYSPVKGFDNLAPVIERCRSDISWIAIQGLSPQEEAMLFCQAKVYIDFGNHPGKDRMPREAAVCGAAVITNTIGSAGYDDVPIPDKYKVQDMQDVEHILDIIYDLIDHFDDRKADFEEYIEIIQDGKKQFDEDIENAIKYYEEKLGSINITHKNDHDYSEIIASAEDILSTLENNFMEMRSTENAHGLSEVSSLSKTIESDYLVNLLHEVIWAVEDDLTK